MFGSPRLLFWITLGSALVGGALLALITDSWWLLLVPVAVHGLASTLVTMGVFRMLGERDKPDPVEQARLDDEGETTATP
jgi:membrane protein implicated in regulation of membrane protease activity